MSKQNPFRTGISFALTIGIGYAACTAVFWLWPEAAATFMNGLFHGLDFRKLQTGPVLFEFGAFLYALAVMVGWALLLGTIFGWLHDRIGGGT
jgi:hypothetical protein